MIEPDKKFKIKSLGELSEAIQDEILTWDDWKANLLQMLWSDETVTERQLDWYKSLSDEDLMDEFEAKFQCEFKEI